MDMLESLKKCSANDYVLLLDNVAISSTIQTKSLGTLIRQLKGIIKFHNQNGKEFIKFDERKWVNTKHVYEIIEFSPKCIDDYKLYISRKYQQKVVGKRSKKKA